MNKKDRMNDILLFSDMNILLDYRNIFSVLVVTIMTELL